MATTTNYGWTTPDDTALVKDGASAIRTLGSSVDTTTKALNPSTTLGDIEYRSSTANTNTRLAIGSTGNVLTVAGGVPTWAAPAAGGGKVLQVVSSTLTGEVATTSSSFVDVGLSVSITPTLSTSKVLVIATLNVAKSNDFTGDATTTALLRGSTIIQRAEDLGYTGTLIRNFVANAFTILDAPATTSSTTYKCQFKSQAGGTSAINSYRTNNLAVSSITVLEIGA
jgi:hypothetical protein